MPMLFSPTIGATARCWFQRANAKNGTYFKLGASRQLVRMEGSMTETGKPSMVAVASFIADRKHNICESSVVNGFFAIGLE
jgi:hypothetical protein